MLNKNDSLIKLQSQFDDSMSLFSALRFENMPSAYSDYLNGIGFFFLFSFGLSLIIFLASYFFSKQNPDSEKFSVYECGFDPFGDSRQKFEVRFFLVGILFIVFDLEISFLFPWSVSLSNLYGGHLLGYYTMFIFLFILTIGLIYEWMKGGLEWE